MLPKSVLGLVTVGQSPRDDLLPHLLPFLPAELTIRQAGALDGLTDEQITKLVTATPHDPLHTRLRNGSAITIGREPLTALLQARIDRLQDEGAKVIVLLCTAEFPTLHSDALLVEPDRLVVNLVRGLRPQALGVLLPLAAQRLAAGKKWRAVEARKVYASALPCGELETIVQAARELQAGSVDLIVADCIGYTPAHKRTIGQVTGKPVILAITAVARLLGELLDS